MLLVIASFALMHTYGIKRGIDFTGGSIIEINYATSTMPEGDVDAIAALGVKPYKIADGEYRFVSVKPYEEAQAAYTSVLNKNKYAYAETQVSSVGPTLGAELTKKAVIAIVVVVLAILLFIAFSFRAVSLPVASWKYGVIAMVTLIHDIIVPTGVYVLLSHFYGAEIDTLFVVALLTIIGISISDKIVVFDRIRENLKVSKGSFDEIVGKSLKQTFTRSINTSVTVILALLALYFFGPSMTKYFTLTLIAGMIVGTYSSIFVASPLLTIWNKK